MCVKPNTTNVSERARVFQNDSYLNFPEYIRESQTKCNIDHVFCVDSFKAMKFHF